MRAASRAWLIGTLALLIVAGQGATPPRVLALSPDSAPPLPAPTGSVVNVSTVAQLNAAVGSLVSGRTIVLAPGTYNLTSTLWLNGSLANVTIRGATNNRNDVVLVGRGMGVADSAVPYGIWTGGGVTNLTIANLTIRDIYRHPVMFNAGTQSPRLYNVRLADAGEQIVKSNPDGAGGGVDNGIVEYSVLEYTNTSPNSYTNGVDVHTGRNWIIRHNLFRRIRAPQGPMAGPAILMWNGSSGTLVEGNTFIDCQREISLGLIERTPNDHEGGIVRNNMIFRNAGAGGDVGIAVFDSPSTAVLHNTIFINGQYPNAIEYRFPNTTGVSIVNNLADRGAQARDGAGGATVQGNVWNAAANWFVEPSSGNLHLVSTATAAIDRGIATAATNDWDNQARPTGSAPDVGADEFIGGPPADTTPPTVTLTSPAQGAVVSGTITISAAASDNVGVAGVRFLSNGTQIGAEDTVAPYQLTMSTVQAPDGPYVLTAIARDTSGLTRTSSAVTITVANPGSNVAGDLNGDGIPDLLFRHTSGALHAWFLGNGAMTGSQPLTPGTVDPVWLVAGVDDFDGNGKSDVLWQHSVTGEVYLWRMDGTRLVTSQSVSTTALARRVVATGDLNGDGHADIVLQNPSGQISAWLMNRTAIASDAALTPAQVASDWRIAGAGDLNHDGRADLIWQHSVTGTLVAWHMNGRTMQASVPFTPGAANPVWRLSAIADLNDDDELDLIWQHSTLGLLHVWYLHGSVLTHAVAFTPDRVNAAWRIVGGR